MSYSFVLNTKPCLEGIDHQMNVMFTDKGNDGKCTEDDSTKKSGA